MKKLLSIAMVAMVLGLTVGCGEEKKPAPAPAPSKAGDKMDKMETPKAPTDKK